MTDKIEKQLLEELSTLRRKVREFEATEAEREQSREKLQKKEALLATFNQMGQNILSSLDVDQILDSLAQQIAHAGIFRSLTISVVDTTRNEYEVIRNYISRDEHGVEAPGMRLSSNQSDDAVVGLRRSLDDPEDFLSRAYRREEITVFRGRRLEEDDQVAVEETGHDPENTMSYFIPVKQRDRVLAMLATGSSRDEEAVMLQRIEAMQPLLDQVAIVLEHARLYREAHTSREKLKSLHDDLEERNRELESEARQRKQQEIKREVAFIMREQVWSMTRREDIENVLRAVRSCLNVGKVPFSFIGINIVEISGGSTNVTFNMVDPEGNVETYRISDDDPSLSTYLRIWKIKEVCYRQDLDEEDVFGEKRRLSTMRSVIDVPFSHGTLALRHPEPSAFSPDHLDLLKEVVGVLSEGFQRLEDIQKLEQRNLELETEVAERLRVEEVLKREYVLHDAEYVIRVAIASMDRPEHLCHVVKEIGAQLDRVGVTHDSCTIQIVNPEGTDFVSIASYIHAEWYDEIMTFIATGTRNAARSHAEEYPCNEYRAFYVRADRTLASPEAHHVVSVARYAA